MYKAGKYGISTYVTDEMIQCGGRLISISCLSGQDWGNVWRI